MSGLFAYARVAPASRTTAAADLHRAAALAGHGILPDNTVIEVVAESVIEFARVGWRALLDGMHEGDTLVVPMLRDLGGDASEVCATVQQLARRDLRVHCLALGAGRVDLAGAAGRPAMEVLTAVAELEQKRRSAHELLAMKTSDTPSPARPKGRRPSLDSAQVTQARRLLASGLSVAEVARRLETSRQTLMRLRAREAMENASKATQPQPGPRRSG